MKQRSHKHNSVPNNCPLEDLSTCLLDFKFHQQLPTAFLQNTFPYEFSEFFVVHQSQNSLDLYTVYGINILITTYITIGQSSFMPAENTEFRDCQTRYKQ